MDFPFIKEAVRQLFTKSSCGMYPLIPSEAAPGYRGRISYDPTKCIGCGMCERVCAGGAISRTIEPLEDGTSRVTLTFDLGSCTFCAHCSDFCSRHAIELTSDYHMAVSDGKDLLVSGSFIKAAPKKPSAKTPPVKAAESAAPAASSPASESTAPVAPASSAETDAAAVTTE